MHLVYRAMEKEPVPTTLPTSLIPPSKRKKSAGAMAGAVPVLPVLSGFMAGPAPLKESLRSTPPLASATLLSNSTVNLSPKHSFKSSSPVCHLIYVSRAIDVGVMVAFISLWAMKGSFLGSMVRINITILLEIKFLYCYTSQYRNCMKYDTLSNQTNVQCHYMLHNYDPLFCITSDNWSFM